ncbi:mitogen-activated protein kinase kinase kinase 1-like, partial [Cynara cardunculus var. scolymus]|uniref:mitogen-activated protein kinase kinase kinase 1-like n=1 Tax=Cynara cardunculus var. scolymus TaxID=59895 RepID=UPI000D623F09
MLAARSRERYKRSMNLYTKQKQKGKGKGVAPKLQRRNAIKNINYDASPSSLSFDSSSAQRTRSLDIPSLSERTSFRIEGIDGEVDVICRSLGLSGPEDLAISEDVWKAHRGGSFPSSSRFRRSHRVSAMESPESDLSESFGSKISFSDDEVKTDDESSTSAEDEEARVLVTNGVKNRNDGVSFGGINEDRLGNEYSQANNGVGLANAEKARVLQDGGDDDDSDKTRERRHAEGESGIKGPGPPLLAPPPVPRVIVDDMGSKWDLIQSFAPRDDEHLESDGPVETIISENMVANVVDERETSGMMASIIDTIVPPFGSDPLDDEDDGSSMAAADLQYSPSPTRQFSGSFENWQKGDILGSGSFGTVYEGFTEHGDFFAVKEVSLLDQDSQGRQSIAQLEQEISLLSNFHHDNIVRYLGTDTGDGKLYIFLELVTRGSLARLYQKYDLRDSQVSVYT